MRSVFVTGASRGLGLEFVRQLAQRSRAPDQVVFASCRNPHQAKGLQKLAAAYNCVRVVELDVQNEDTYPAAFECVHKIVGENGLNVLINNAGINRGATIKYGAMTRREIADVFDVNTVSPIRVTDLFLPMIKRAATCSPVKTMSAERAAVCNISSSLGSIANNASGGYAVFRESKAALNMTTKSLSLELKRDNILVMSLCPGWVRTDTGGPFAIQSTTESVQKLLDIIDSADDQCHGKLIRSTVPASFYDF
ncbi:C-signal-like [Diadema antillarum]|uniref:C-signal-like n=1 Tax=Diadema antillarum TaxID=105358 RepID=UPI003A876447